MRAVDLYWKTNPEWYGYPDDWNDATPFLTDKAPPEARESFERYMKDREERKRKAAEAEKKKEDL
jgi:hypothetical protein